MPMERAHIWVGVFPSEDYFEEYFTEVTIPDREEAISQFTVDQGESYIDHDWLERSYMENTSVEDLITGHSYADDYIYDVIEIMKTKRIQHVNAFVMVDLQEVSDPKSITHQDFQLWYIGSFTCSV
jgi:hypothetical protein